MKKFAYVAAISTWLLALPAFAADQPAVDPDLAKFRAAYTSGDGLAYVVINDDKDEHIYRYGDASRTTAKKDARGYMLFTCNAPHVFISQKAEDKAALTKATVVKPGRAAICRAGCEIPGGLPQPSREVRNT